MSRLLVASLLVLASQGCGSTPVPALDAGAVDVADGGRDGDAGTDGGGADGGDERPLPTRDERIADRSLVKWMGVADGQPWWVEERLAPQPMDVGDRDLGPRAVVRAAPDRRVVWLPPESDRLTDAALHPSGEWSAVGVGSDRRVFLARGDRDGLRDRIVLDDPALATDARAWTSTPRMVPRIGALSEASPAVAADGEDVVVSLVSEDFAVLLYRWRRTGGAFARGPRTLVSPAVVVTPFLPIGGSFDDFDAVVSPYQARLGVDAQGRAYVAHFTDLRRVQVHNAAFGTRLDLVRERLYPRENSSDAMLTRVERDGAIGFVRVVGTADVEDEVFGLAVGADRVAILGRSRRELGRDNTELHVMVAEVGLDGAVRGTTTIDALDSGLAQSGAYVGGDLWVGGTESWVQNPSGRSVLEEGQPLLVRLRDGATGRVVTRFTDVLPATAGHAELRAVSAVRGGLLLGGHERGPLTHTADGDRSLVRSDAWWCARPTP
ncbi:MAG: hypothetical protein Q8S73_45605 [Deltaproteobacteria bacterium]|nr:hypothetical protein [Myxococcales bacterium]MDP3221447.1 hypothetical protein [Deltaproteobacteria bacterium]